MSSYGVKAHGSSKRRQQQIHLKRRTVPQVIHKCYSSLVASYSHVARKGVLCLCIAFHGKHRCRSMVLLVSCFKICTKKQCGPQVASFHAFEVLNLMAIDLPKLWQPAKNVDLVSGKLPWAVCGGGMPNTQWFIYIHISFTILVGVFGVGMCCGLPSRPKACDLSIVFLSNQTSPILLSPKSIPRRSSCSEVCPADAQRILLSDMKAESRMLPKDSAV